MDGIISCIQSDIDNVRKDILDMLEGNALYTDLPTFTTEKIELNTKEQIFSAMVILGFLSYHDSWLTIPNKELKIKFVETLKSEMFGEFARVIRNSNDLLKATITKDTETMAELLKDAHSLYSSTQTYNKESTLASIVQIAYLTALKKYAIHREFKSGEGYADFVCQYELASIAAPDLCTRQGTTYHSNPCASTRSVKFTSELELSSSL